VNVLSRNLGTRLMVFSILIVAIPIAILGVVALHCTASTMEDMAQKNLDSTIEAARAVVDGRIRELTKVVGIYRDDEVFVKYLVDKNKDELRKLITDLKNEVEADFVVVFDKDGRVLVRSNNNLSGDRELYDLVLKALSGNKVEGFEIIDEETMEKEGLEHLQLEVIPTQNMANIDRDIGRKGLALVSVKPIEDKNGNIIGVLLAADVLNKDYALVDKIEKITGGNAVTIFLDGLRVSTNVQKDGDRAIGTVVSQEVYDTVINRGDIYRGRAFVVNKWYLTTYEPIRNSDGKIIGMLFVGVPEEQFVAHTSNIRNQIMGVGVLGLLVAVGLARVNSRKITKPITELVEVADKIGKGDYTARVTIKSSDEIGLLAESINRMAEAIQKNTEELKELVDKLPIPTLILDKDHKIKYWNKAIEDLTGYTAEEMVGTDNQWKPFYDTKRPILADIVMDNPEDADKYYSKIRRSKVIKGAYSAEGGV